MRGTTQQKQQSQAPKWEYSVKEYRNKKWKKKESVLLNRSPNIRSDKMSENFARSSSITMDARWRWLMILSDSSESIIGRHEIHFKIDLNNECKYLKTKTKMKWKEKTRFMCNVLCQPVWSAIPFSRSVIGDLSDLSWIICWRHWHDYLL